MNDIRSFVHIDGLAINKSRKKPEHRRVICVYMLSNRQERTYKMDRIILIITIEKNMNFAVKEAYQALA